jgi:hypothetical protein
MSEKIVPKPIYLDIIVRMSYDRPEVNEDAQKN